jgi:hypothetical protein
MTNAYKLVHVDPAKFVAQIDNSPVLESTRALLAQCFGVSISTQLQYEQWFDNCNCISDIPDFFNDLGEVYHYTSRFSTRPNRAPRTLGESIDWYQLLLKAPEDSTFRVISTSRRICEVLKECHILHRGLNYYLLPGRWEFGRPSENVEIFADNVFVG